MLAIAATPGATRAELISWPEPPAPGPGQLLCQTLQLGVCGTDREILQSGRPLVPSGSRHLVLGHECLARVLETGADVPSPAVGQLVVPLVRRPRGPQPFRVDLLAFGNYTERGIVQEHGFSTPRWLDRPEFLLPVNPRIAPVAVLAEPLSVAEKAVHEALLLQQARLGERVWDDRPPRVLITGLGPIGFAALLACRCRHWPATLCGRDLPSSRRAELGKALGADYLPSERLAAEPDDVETDGFDLLLECTGNDRVLMQAASWLAARGAMVWLGSSRSPQVRDHNLDQLIRQAVLRNHLFLGSVNAAPRDFADALRHLEMLWDQTPQLLEALITCRVSPADSLWHYHHREAGGIKTVLMYD